jgi:hypothetical protein
MTQVWKLIATAPKDGTHIIGLTQWGALEVWWKRDTYEGEFWQDRGDSEPEPTHWIPMPLLIDGANERSWVIRKNGYFYRANRSGYTQEVSAAGLYTEQEARQEATIEPKSMSAHPVSEFL